MWIDGSSMTWLTFVAELQSFSRQVQADGAFAYIRLPRGCEVPARQLIHDLDISDHVEILNQD